MVLELLVPFTPSPTEICSADLLHLVQVLSISAEFVCRQKLIVVLKLTLR